MSPREKLLAFLPHLRHAFGQARREGEVQIGVIAAKPDGGMRCVARLNGEEFLSDLCGLLGVATKNTREEELEAAAAGIVSMFGPVRNT